MWPGEGTIYMMQEMSFRAPVFVEKDYKACFKVAEINEENQVWRKLGLKWQK